MTVTDVVKKDSKKSIIYIDYNKAFELYNREIKKFSIQKDEEISLHTYEEIINDILPKRCMERALYLIQSSDKTEEDLKNKLLQGTYPEKIIEDVIDKLKNYDYIDDYRYSYNYVKYNVRIKSIKKIVFDLSSKGVKKEIIENVFNVLEDEEYDIENMQKDIIKKEFIKKNFDFNINDKNIYNKMINSLMRKGFKYDDIMHVFYELKK